jgi:hypothetical protein
MVGRRDEGDGADRQAPHGGDVRERRRLCRSAKGQREYTFRNIRQHGLGGVGRAGSLWGGAGQRGAGLGRMGQNSKKILF